MGVKAVLVASKSSEFPRDDKDGSKRHGGRGQISPPATPALLPPPRRQREIRLAASFRKYHPAVGRTDLVVAHAAHVGCRRVATPGASAPSRPRRDARIRPRCPWTVSWSYIADEASDGACTMRFGTKDHGVVLPQLAFYIAPVHGEDRISRNHVETKTRVGRRHPRGFRCHNGAHASAISRDPVCIPTPAIFAYTISLLSCSTRFSMLPAASQSRSGPGLIIWLARDADP